jgi:PKD repeat protein
MRNKSTQFIPIILSIVIIFTAMACGSGSNPPSTVPIANPGGPYSGNVNQPLAFNGSGSSAPSGRSITSYAWIFGDGGSGTGASPTHTYTIAGNYSATLTVTDSSGATGSSSVAVQINTAPVAKPGGPYTGKVGVPVTFDASGSTIPPGQVPGFTWNFGDGSGNVGPIAQAQTTHTYSSPCTCTVTLTVTVGTGGSSFATTTATITAGPAPGRESAPSTFFAIGPAADASSQFAYVLTTSPSGGSSLTIQTIDNATGNLQSTEVAPPSLDSNFLAAGMITDPSRKFLYVYGGNSVLTFSIATETGALIPSGTITTNGSADIPANQALIFSPNGKSAFFITQNPSAADSTEPGSITRFSVDPNTGTLGAVETVSTQVSRPQSSAIDPSGKFLYISGFASAAPQIAVLSVAPGTGALTPISNSPLTIESGIVASSIAVDSTGRFMFAAGRNSSANSATLSTFTINSGTGAFAQSSSPLDLGETVADATSLALAPSANYGYVLTVSARTNATARQSVQLFQWNIQTGTPAIGNSSVEYNDVRNQPVPTVGNLVLFSPNQSVGTSTSNPTPHIFLFVPGLPGSLIVAPPAI